jgi:transposase-like protein
MMEKGGVFVDLSSINRWAIRPMLNFKFLRSARKVLPGIELMHMIRKG